MILIDELLYYGFTEREIPFYGYVYALNGFELYFDTCKITYNEKEIECINELKEYYLKETGKEL